MTVDDDSVRPATDRVKGAIFNMLQNRLRLADAAVLDLFAGSGSLGFEALSRGAASTVFVDDSPEALESVERNADALGCIDACEEIQADAADFIGKTSSSFDLIFADPPYAYDGTEGLPAAIFGRNLLKKEGFLIIEHARRTTFEPSALYAIAERREFGNTHVSFFTHPSQRPSPAT